MAVEKKLPRTRPANNKLDADENANVGGAGPFQEMGVVQAIRDRHYDELMQGRCPICNVLMVARLGRQGPYFHCGCPPKKKPPQAKLEVERLEDRS